MSRLRNWSQSPAMTNPLQVLSWSLCRRTVLHCRWHCLLLRACHRTPHEPSLALQHVNSSVLHVCCAYQIDTRCIHHIEIDYPFRSCHTHLIWICWWMVRKPQPSQSAMVHTKSQATLKREAPKAKELALQHALAMYQEALARMKYSLFMMLIQHYSTGKHN